MQKSNSYLYSICAVAMFGGLMFGFDIAIISGANASLQSYFHLSELELGWGTSSLILGAIFGAIISGILTDRYGRKVILVNMLFTFVAIYLIDKIGRRKMYNAGSASMALMLVVLSASYFFNMKGGILTITSVFIFIASFAACIGPVF